MLKMQKLVYERIVSNTRDIRWDLPEGLTAGELAGVCPRLIVQPHTLEQGMGLLYRLSLALEFELHRGQGHIIQDSGRALRRVSALERLRYNKGPAGGFKVWGSGAGPGGGPGFRQADRAQGKPGGLCGTAQIRDGLPAGRSARAAQRRVRDRKEHDGPADARIRGESGDSERGRAVCDPELL